MEEIQQNDIPGRGIDFLYVDEAQDHLMVDVAREYHGRPGSRSGTNYAISLSLSPSIALSKPPWPVLRWGHGTDDLSRQHIPIY